MSKLENKVAIITGAAESIGIITAKIFLEEDENVLHIKTKNAHWNVEGTDYHDKHTFPLCCIQHNGDSQQEDADPVFKKKKDGHLGMPVNRHYIFITDPSFEI
ncbi:hypothetical protein MKS83_20800 [Chryseobacterium sp. Y16C]|uniref:hypothetical protein n=1 Tax=Chryseobacterium sp. Y16C TaxID=2920939 RepID=UPI001F0ADA34|nr:hypothetical protein [Chryseobacterium sp. Y16C]UMQ41810.1 hypothetical protein MKS83_20800 [Chryseobacterium sp. Y16C]